VSSPVRMPEEVREAMVAHARFTLPEEACGLLAGTAGDDLRMVFCLTNRARSRYRFTVDPVEHYRAMQHAERRGLGVVGVFHSHPTSPARPSPADIAGALDPEWVYVVVSLADPATPDVRAYEIRGGGATERVIEPPSAVAGSPR